jgi:hypothetical protein
MFDSIEHKATQTVDIPSNNKVLCRYCGTKTVQLINHTIPSFVCSNCGGRCIIYIEEKDISSKTNPDMSYTIKAAYKIIWNRINIIDKENKE